MPDNTAHDGYHWSDAHTLDELIDAVSKLRMRLAFAHGAYEDANMLGDVEAALQEFDALRTKHEAR